MPRRIWINNGQDSYDLVEVKAASEHDLQEVIKLQPQLIPAEDLGLDGDLLVVGRETSLGSGAVDLLCLASSGDLVIVEFKTGPQNPDFRHALAQVIDYGSDLWQIGYVNDFDQGVVQRYLASPHVDPRFRGCTDLASAVKLTDWGLDDTGWEALVERLGEVLSSGDFHFVVAAQRFTPAMEASRDYLNATMKVGSFHLVQVIRLEGRQVQAYSAQVVPGVASSKAINRTGPSTLTNETAFLDRIEDPDYREAMSDLLAAVQSLGLQLAWGTKGASIRLRTPDRTEPLSIGWVFVGSDSWFTARHVTLGADDMSLKSTPSVADAIERYREHARAITGARPAAGSLDAYVFEPGVFPTVKSEVIQTIEALVKEVSGSD